MQGHGLNSDSWTSLLPQTLSDSFVFKFTVGLGAGLYNVTLNSPASDQVGTHLFFLLVIFLSFVWNHFFFLVCQLSLIYSSLIFDTLGGYNYAANSIDVSGLTQMLFTVNAVSDVCILIGANAIPQVIHWE